MYIFINYTVATYNTSVCETGEEMYREIFRITAAV